MFDDLLTRSNPVREIPNTSCLTRVGATRPSRFLQTPDPRPVYRIVTREKPCNLWGGKKNVFVVNDGSPQPPNKTKQAMSFVLSVFFFIFSLLL